MEALTLGVKHSPFVCINTKIRKCYFKEPELYLYKQAVKRINEVDPAMFISETCEHGR